MAGTMALAGALSASLVLGASLLGVGAAAVWSQRLSATTDAAALAAADAASGAVAGVPCERAAQIAATVGAALASCQLDGLVATVSLTGVFGIVPVTAAARAGPPP